MKIDYPAGVKRDWIDRNPIVSALVYNGQNVAPHALNERWGYTCPAGKRAHIELISINLMRTAVATTPNLAQAWVQIDDMTVQAGFGQCMVLGNVVGNEQHQTFGQFGWLTAGQSVSAYTADPSTGGTFAYYIAAQIVEFDA